MNKEYIKSILDAIIKSDNYLEIAIKSMPEYMNVYFNNVCDAKIILNDIIKSLKEELKK